MRMLVYFIADDKKPRELWLIYYEELDVYISKITGALRYERATIPVGYTSEAVNKEVPSKADIVMGCVICGY
ncbi:hypothetical protein [Aquibacillus sediminis]|uniref:hypothetical protein n=1 Tax=Aquibacillus sediminis TaxID=2574734 RepID=UPI0011097BFA|nr:hypothetical protein [Aquibacillus sediminis]